MSRQLHQRPSQLYSLSDTYVAWCFDRAVTLWGTAVEQAVQAKTEKAKTKAGRDRAVKSVMDKYLYCDNPAATPGRFRDPMELLRRR